MTKEEKAAYDREYRAKNRARIAEVKRADVLANFEARSANVKAWHAANAERVAEIKRDWRERNRVEPKPRTKMPEAERKARAVARVVKWREENPEKYLAQLDKAGYKPRSPAQKARHASDQSLRTRLLQKSRPPWADQAAITAIYLEAQRKGLHVDHVIPLRGKTVSGLHVHTILHVPATTENCRKRNKLPKECQHAD